MQRWLCLIYNGTLEKVFIPENFSIASYNQKMRAGHFHREVANENKQFKGII